MNEGSGTWCLVSSPPFFLCNLRNVSSRRIGIVQSVTPRFPERRHREILVAFHGAIIIS